MRCLKCGSTQIKKLEGPDNFLPVKLEGEVTKRAKIKTKQKYICLEESCGYEWEKDLNFRQSI